MINWLKENRACKKGINWCKENCGTMEDVWDRLERIDWLVWVACIKGVLTDKELRLFACFCARQNWHLLIDERSRNAVEVAERFANGNATKEELKAAYAAATRAAYASYADAADAARAASASAAYDDAGKEQMEWLRANTTPNFGGTK